MTLPPNSYIAKKLSGEIDPADEAKAMMEPSRKAARLLRRASFLAWSGWAYGLIATVVAIIEAVRR